METVEAEGQAEAQAETQAETQEKPVGTAATGGTFYFQDGGSLLDKGSYGCIFDPPLLCKGRSRPFKSGRLGKFTGEVDIGNEIGVALHFKNEPAARQYMILPYLDTLCEPKARAQQKEKDFDKCEPMNRFGYSTFKHYEMDYGGVTLSKKLRSLDAAFNVDIFIRRMLEIGAFLALNGIVHNDLHSHNVLVNKHFIPRLIDFGLSIVVKNISSSTIRQLGAVYDPSLWAVPPEYTVGHGLNDGVSFSRILYDLRKQKVALLYAERYLGLSRTRQLAELKAFWDTSRTVQEGDWLNFLKMYWPVMDSWSIGGILVDILRRLLIHKRFTESAQWRSIRVKLRTVLRGLLRASPRERLDCVEALALYDPANDLVTGDVGRAWLDKREKTRARLG